MPREPKQPRPLDANGDPVFAKEELAKIYAAEKADVMDDWPYSKRELDEINADMGGGCLHMIGELLGTMECKHGLGAHKDSTPAMMYPEWIICCTRKALEKQRERDAMVARDFIMGKIDPASKTNEKVLISGIGADCYERVLNFRLHPDYIPKLKEPACPSS